MHWTRLMVSEPKQERVLEELREKLAKDFGITVNGPYITIRWDNRSVTMIATDIYSGKITHGTWLCEARPKSYCEFDELDENQDRCIWCGNPQERK